MYIYIYLYEVTAGRASAEVTKFAFCPSSVTSSSVFDTAPSDDGPVDGLRWPPVIVARRLLVPPSLAARDSPMIAILFRCARSFFTSGTASGAIRFSSDI